MFKSLELVPSQQMIKISLSSQMMAGQNYTIQFTDFYAPIRNDLTGIYKGSFKRDGETKYVSWKVHVTFKTIKSVNIYSSKANRMQNLILIPMTF